MDTTCIAKTGHDSNQTLEKMAGEIKNGQSKDTYIVRRMTQAEVEQNETTQHRKLKNEQYGPTFALEGLPFLFSNTTHTILLIIRFG